MTDEEARGTSGGAAGTSGLSARALTALLLSAVFLFGLIRIAANVYSYIADREGAGVIVPPTIAWMLEGSSLIAWAVVMIPCWFAVRRIRPPRVALPWAVAIHALLAIPVSLGHIALMTAFLDGPECLFRRLHRRTESRERVQDHCISQSPQF